jgi:hypothetical protein
MGACFAAAIDARLESDRDCPASADNATARAQTTIENTIDDLLVEFTDDYLTN